MPTCDKEGKGYMSFNCFMNKNSIYMYSTTFKLKTPKNVHPSFMFLMLEGSQVGWCLSSVVIGREAGYILDSRDGRFGLKNVPVTMLKNLTQKQRTANEQLSCHATPYVCS